MTIYYYESEVTKVCEFLGADKPTVMEWLENNKKTDKYIEFQLISDMGCDILQLTYGKNSLSKIKDRVICHVSCLGTQFKEQ